MGKDIRQFLNDEFIFDGEIKDSDSLLDNGVIDSMGVLRIVEFIEKNYNIKVKNDEITPDNFDSIDKIKNYIENKK
jgi:acyl carrier protein